MNDFPLQLALFGGEVSLLDRARAAGFPSIRIRRGYVIRGERRWTAFLAQQRWRRGELAAASAALAALERRV